jgi:hypothetical protein
MQQSDLKAMFNHYFQNQQGPICRLIPIIRAMVEALQNTRGLKFCGSSVLFAYCLETGKTEAKIIDFQNVVTIEQNAIDEEIIFGL